MQFSESTPQPALWSSSDRRSSDPSCYDPLSASLARLWDRRFSSVVRRTNRGFFGNRGDSASRFVAEVNKVGESARDVQASNVPKTPRMRPRRSIQLGSGFRRRVAIRKAHASGAVTSTSTWATTAIIEKTSRPLNRTFLTF